jgi:ATP-binding protein involved in chromosome partitioning
MTQQPNLSQARSRIEGMKRQFEQKRQIEESLSGIKKKIGVYSGKGGVGKTTVAINIATTLAHQGQKVGVLDVDIDCPNIVRALNISDQPLIDENKKMIPPERFGVKVMSMAFFQENQDEAIIWRGPMIHNAINQMLQSTDWGDLDYLIIDLPPGTSDAPLTVMQVLTMDGFVVVTTPQELAKIDAKRSINMVKKLQIAVLGIVENMSGEFFGTGAGLEIASELEIDFLGTISMRSEYKDMSRPTTLISDNVLSEYRAISEKMIEAVEKQ